MNNAIIDESPVCAVIDATTTMRHATTTHNRRINTRYDKIFVNISIRHMSTGDREQGTGADYMKTFHSMSFTVHCGERGH